MAEEATQGLLSVVAAGDIVPTTRLARDEDLTPGVSDALEQLRGADIAFATLEAALTDRGEPCDKVVMYRVSPSIAPDIAAMGFDLVSLANNQTLNYGRPGLLQTMELLEAHGVRHVGAGMTADEAWSPVVLHGRVAFIAFTCVAPPGWAATADQPGLAAVRVRTAYEVDARWEAEEPGIAPRVRTWLDADELRLPFEAVRRARALADVVIVSVHWGVGGEVRRADYQQQLGRTLLAAGATCVVGSHPPPLQGFEINDRGLISYSQGTFIRQQPVAPQLADFYARMPRAACLLKLELGADGPRTACVVPTTLDRTQIGAIADGAESAAILQHILARSQGLTPRMSIGERRVQIDLRGLAEPSERGRVPDLTTTSPPGPGSTPPLVSAVDVDPGGA